MHRSCCCMPDICQCRRTPGLPPRPHQRSVNGATAVAAAAAAGGSAGGLGLGLLKQRTKGAKFPSGLWALWALWSSKMAKTTSRKQPTRVRCVSIFLDKNRRYIGKSQSERPPERTQRTPHLLRLHLLDRHLPPAVAGVAPPQHLPGRLRPQYFLTRTGVT
jgi:hypothetical protein